MRDDGRGGGAGVKRRLFNLAAIASLVLCLLLMIVLVWSYCNFIDVVWDAQAIEGPYVVCRCVGGTAVYGRGYLYWDKLIDTPQNSPLHRNPNDPPGFRYGKWPAGSRLLPIPGFFGRMGFSLENIDKKGVVPDRSESRIISRGFTFPIWFSIAMTAIAPLIAFVRRCQASIARRRTFAGHCAICGYDLRASPERCPECGTAVAAAVEVEA
jgi:hypothetical protein